MSEKIEPKIGDRESRKVTDPKNRRLYGYVCEVCDNHIQIPIHPMDAGDTVRVGCPECQDITEHKSRRERIND